MGRASAAFQMINDRKLFRQIAPTCFFIVSAHPFHHDKKNVPS